MNVQQRKFIVAVISVFAFLTPATGAVVSFSNAIAAGASVQDAPLTVAACQTNCTDDMHW